MLASSSTALIHWIQPLHDTSRLKRRPHRVFRQQREPSKDLSLLWVIQLGRHTGFPQTFPNASPEKSFQFNGTFLRFAVSFQGRLDEMLFYGSLGNRASRCSH